MVQVLIVDEVLKEQNRRYKTTGNDGLELPKDLLISGGWAVLSESLGEESYWTMLRLLRSQGQ